MAPIFLVSSVLLTGLSNRAKSANALRKALPEFAVRFAPVALTFVALAREILPRLRGGKALASLRHGSCALRASSRCRAQRVIECWLRPQRLNTPFGGLCAG